jgi:hypothetical protein
MTKLRVLVQYFPHFTDISFKQIKHYTHMYVCMYMDVFIFLYVYITIVCCV